MAYTKPLGQLHRFMENVSLPYIKDVREKLSIPDQVALVIFHVLKGHMCDSMHTLLERNKIFQVHVPNNCTDLFQPLDLRVNEPFKDTTEQVICPGSQQAIRRWYTI